MRQTKTRQTKTRQRGKIVGGRKSRRVKGRKSRKLNRRLRKGSRSLHRHSKLAKGGEGGDDKKATPVGTTLTDQQISEERKKLETARTDAYNKSKIDDDELRAETPDKFAARLAPVKMAQEALDNFNNSYPPPAPPPAKRTPFSRISSFGRSLGRGLLAVGEEVGGLIIKKGHTGIDPDGTKIYNPFGSDEFDFEGQDDEKYSWFGYVKDEGLDQGLDRSRLNKGGKR